MRYLKSLVLFAVLILLPLGSWYYLQSGLDYRKALMQELEGNGEKISDLQIDDKLKQTLEKKTSLIIYDNTRLSEEDLGILKERFEDQYTFQLIEDSRYAAGKLGSFAMLIDTSGKIRHEYNDVDDLGKIVEHLAVVIPRKPEKDIVTKK